MQPFFCVGIRRDAAVGRIFFQQACEGGPPGFDIQALLRAEMVVYCGGVDLRQADYLLMGGAAIAFFGEQSAGDAEYPLSCLLPVFSAAHVNLQFVSRSFQACNSSNYFNYMLEKGIFKPRLLKIAKYGFWEYIIGCSLNI